MKITNLLAVLVLVSCVTGCFSPNVRTFRNERVEAIGFRSGGDWQYDTLTIGTQEHPFNAQTPLTVRLPNGMVLTAAELIANTIPTAVVQSNGVCVTDNGTVKQCGLCRWGGADGQWHSPVLVCADAQVLTFPISEKELIRVFGPARVVEDRFCW